MKKFAVVLAGCGVYDGAEIHEAVLTLLAIDRQGGSYQVFAPDMKQHHVVHHLTGQEMPEERNVLAESARIARGNIKDLSALDMNDFDALVFPGGYGVAKNLCDWAFRGPDCQVHPEVTRIIQQCLGLDKALGAMCIAPVMLGKIMGKVEITIGDDPVTASQVEKMGSKHRVTAHGQVIRDPGRKIFTTPCYMLDARISDIAAGTENLVQEMLKVM